MKDLSKGHNKEPHVTVNHQQALVAYQRRIANILESFTDAFFEVTADWTITYWNKQAEVLLGMPREQALGKNLWDLYKDAVSLKFYTEYHRAVAENVSVRFEEFYPSVNAWFEVAAFPSGDGLSVYFKDITAIKRATAQLHAQKKKYTELFNLSPLPQWVYDVDTLKFLDVNEAAVVHYGYTKAEFLEMTIAEIRPAADVPYLDSILAQEIKFGCSNKSGVRHQKKNGEIIHVYVEGNSVSFDRSRARLVMVIDRTQEIESRMAMEESIARFDIVSKATSDAIWDLNVCTGEMIWNQGIRGIFGYKKTKYDNTWWRAQVHPDDLDALTRKFNLLFKKRQTRSSHEYRFKKADGSYSIVLDRFFVLFNQQGDAVRIIGSMQDVTERVIQLRAIEEQNQKLREISWIQAHRVRGPLSDILGLTSLLAHDDMTVEEIKEIGANLKEAAQNLDLVVRDIVKKT